MAYGASTNHRNHEIRREYLTDLARPGVITFFTPIFPAKQKEIRVAEALEQMHDGTPGLWKEGIIETGDEE